jgi:hypothetical protein
VCKAFCNFSRLAHTTGDVAMMHTGGEKSFSARDRVRDLRGMARVACFTMNANSSHPTTHHPPQPAIRPHPKQISNPAATVIHRNSRTCTQELVRKPHRTENATHSTEQWHARSYSRPSVGWITETLGRQFPRMPAWDLVVPRGGTAVVAS